MNFIINPLSFNGIFPVPNLLVDENICLASRIQLQSLLYLLRYGNIRQVTTEEIAQAIHSDEEEVADALLFWCERGLVLSQGQTPEAPTVKKDEKTSSPQKEVPEIFITKPSHEEVASRLKNSAELSLFFQQAQASLGKPIGYEGQSTLLMLHDGYGLPLEIIIMAIEYCVLQKKDGMKHISSLARRWCELGIDTIEGVNQYLEEHTAVDETWDKLRSMTEITNRHPTEKQRAYFNSWIKELNYSVEVIYLAYEESVDHTGRMYMPYMDKVLRKWHAAEVRTPLDVKKFREDWENKKKKSAKKKTETKKEETNENEASYDIDLFMKEALNLSYKKTGND